MLKLIIPNVLDNKRFEGDPIEEDDLLMGVYTSRRWLWLMNPHDAIILPNHPPKEVIDYIVEIKQIDPINIVVLEKDPKLVVSESLRAPSLLSHLKKIVKNPSSWVIDPFFYTPAVIDLAEELGISIPTKWRALVRQNFYQRVNCKSYFRQLSIAHDIPIPTGEVCGSAKQLATAIKKFLPETGQVIVKQDFSAGGAGNIGLSTNPKTLFTGISKQIALQDANQTARDLWAAYTSLANNQLIAEVYYPNRGVFTCDIYIPYSSSEKLRLINYGEIRMDNNWIGGEIPPHRLDPSLVDGFVSVTLKLGSLLQEQGYYGYMCSDAILTENNQLVMTEINARQSGFLHADTLARHLFGPAYMDQVTLLLRKDVKIGSFEKAYRSLKEAGLLFQSNGRKTGVIFLTVYDIRAEFLIIAPDSSSAHDLESAFLKILSKGRD